MIGVGIAPHKAHKQPFFIVISSSFNSFNGILAVLFFA
jgi:hypothetical protein